MTRKQSAGLLLFRKKITGIEVLLVHPGGPYWKNKDSGVWSIPKGEFDETEDALKAAQREFLEETGKTANGDFIQLNPVTQKSGKKIFAWALEQDIDVSTIVSNQFEMEWPPRSGKFQNFPEIDRAGWFTIIDARKKINEAQIALLNELEEILKT